MSTSRSMSTTSIMIYMYRSQGFPNIVGLQKWPAGSYENLASPPPPPPPPPAMEPGRETSMLIRKISP